MALRRHGVRQRCVGPGGWRSCPGHRSRFATAAVPPTSSEGVKEEIHGALALVRSGSANEVIRARVGEEIEAWKVTEIEPRRLVLSHDDRLVSFALFANQKGNDFPLFTNPKGKDTVVRKPPAGPGQTVPTAGPGQTMRQRRAAVVFQ